MIQLHYLQLKLERNHTISYQQHVKFAQNTKPARETKKKKKYREREREDSHTHTTSKQSDALLSRISLRMQSLQLTAEQITIAIMYRTRYTIATKN